MSGSISEYSNAENAAFDRGYNDGYEEGKAAGAAVPPFDDAKPITLGIIADILRPIKALGATRESMIYVVNQVWWGEAKATSATTPPPNRHYLGDDQVVDDTKIRFFVGRMTRTAQLVRFVEEEYQYGRHTAWRAIDYVTHPASLKRSGRHRRDQD